MKNKIVSNEAVQAALDAYWRVYGIDDGAMQAALTAAFPIMLREVATDISKNGCPNGFHPYLVQLADSFSEGDG